MKTIDFFAETQADWFQEFKDAELSEVFEVTDVHTKIFEFDDVPF